MTETSRSADSRRPRVAIVIVGVIAGLTWAAALRAFMIELAGAASAFGWWGTFGAILLPGAMVGGLLAWGWTRGGRGRASWLFLLAPLLLAIVPLAEPGAIERLVSSALGGGALGVAVTLVAGGFALSGRGPVWARILAALSAVGLLVGFALTGALVVGPRLEVGTPRGAWVAVLVVGLMVLGMIATAAGGRRAPR